MDVIRRGAFTLSIHVKRRNAPNVASRTFGVVNSHDHSSIGVSINCPGSPFNQKAPCRKESSCRPTDCAYFYPLGFVPMYMETDVMRQHQIA